MSEKPYFPMFVDLAEKKIVVAGGGKIAARRVKTLCEFAEDITVVAPRIEKELEELEQQGRIRVRKRCFLEEDIADADLVLAATDDHEVNEQIYEHCRERRICVNIASDKEKCDFFFPGICRQDHLVVGISASGLDHKAAAQMRRKIQSVMSKQETEGEKDGE